MSLKTSTFIKKKYTSIYTVNAEEKKNTHNNKKRVLNVLYLTLLTEQFKFRDIQFEKIKAYLCRVKQSRNTGGNPGNIHTVFVYK